MRHGPIKMIAINELGKKAQKILKDADAYISFMNDVCSPMETLPLYKKDYEIIKDSVKAAAKAKKIDFTVEDFEYRNLKIVCHE